MSSFYLLDLVLGQSDTMSQIILGVLRSEEKKELLFRAYSGQSSRGTGRPNGILPCFPPRWSPVRIPPHTGALQGSPHAQASVSRHVTFLSKSFS